ncbi:arsenate reductase (glutaredoxin) [Polaribacter sp. HL-MS24]|uniref:arsenate reductase (glutaredoxin) n=1 Tax=Polaribacter sp. HL-MS24 TaxID=3077735 RepID=UPI0029342FEE|nr:arsenate reductase (glutaredoxin) [Polaribacter sp. HL-MS24]WOC40403.1 arsenate reductase (glutaredoxin) [Polaribacter sp. HL-MS24]
MIKIYHNPRCSKSREGVQILENSKVDFEIVKYLDDNLSEKELTQIIHLLKISPLDLVRKNEKIWKENFKGNNYTELELIEILTKNPKLIERPIVVNNKKALVGRPPSVILSIL